ncbi:transmembrane protein, putative (macronuclear) [Tetrahymena thermophila SB210]|uniref:Transmembrane protein, putative n=1 Tax=Tetrahymena thermophila (strain SB210) TaxID=312017 RepID=W7X4Q9_TETTS|nr:transmembrane protein, putative [Tetrahymena thermophila SB210]EWS72402.1 transmembrane protein, putative [Tetrahymena thermophila SB210]|eukprot:XP_012655058.1 transmembrane protein, putative [Tetrahymena thermophila SB210]
MNQQINKQKKQKPKIKNEFNQQKKNTNTIKKINQIKNQQINQKNQQNLFLYQKIYKFKSNKLFLNKTKCQILEFSATCQSRTQTSDAPIASIYQQQKINNYENTQKQIQKIYKYNKNQFILRCILSVFKCASISILFNALIQLLLFKY